MAGLAFLVLEVGLFALVLFLLNARDRRRDRAVAAILCACPASLRASVAIRARAPLLRRGVMLALDMSACDDDDVWSTVRQLVTALPPRVALVVSTQYGPIRSAVISVRVGSAAYRSRPS